MSFFFDFLMKFIYFFVNFCFFSFAFFREFFYLFFVFLGFFFAFNKFVQICVICIRSGRFISNASVHSDNFATRKVVGIITSSIIRSTCYPRPYNSRAITGTNLKAKLFSNTGGVAYKDWPEDRPEIIFLQKWTGQDRTGDTFLVIFRIGQN